MICSIVEIDKVKWLFNLVKWIETGICLFLTVCEVGNVAKQ